MTGIKDWNFPAFFQAEDELVALGFDVINPAHNDGATVQEALQSAGSPESPNKLWSDYMKRDLPHVMEVDMLCLLPGWQSSRGAQLEVHVAKALGLPLMVLKDGNLVPRLEVLGLSGYARSGKDTVAEHLIETQGYTRISFADPMREALVALDPVIHLGGYPMGLASAVRMVGWEKLKGMSNDIRPLMQRFGTEVGREMFGQNFWVDLALSRIPDGGKVVFADVRFPNEANAIRDLGGEIWRVEREGVVAANAHISERALDDYMFDSIIANTGTLEDLYAAVDALIK
jgi:hypothetical protein